MTARCRRLAAILIIGLVSLLGGNAWSDEGVTRSHGLSVFGDLKYGPDFKRFDYVNPDAPRGGTLRLAGIDSFDSMNPYILKGVEPSGIGLTFATLMERAQDEPDAMYGYVAESVAMPADRSWIEFTLRPEVKFHDGSPITADDVVFTFNILVTKGHPRYRLVLANVIKAEALGPRRVRFSFRPGNNRDLPVQVAALPVLSHAYYAKRKFDKTTLVPPLGSGPYRVANVEGGRYVVYRRVHNYWGDTLPVMKGRYNFDTIRVDYYRDRGVAFQAFFAGEYDLREEFVSRTWATQYDKPALRAGLVVRETVKDETPSGVQAFFFNLRRDKFRDRRVREALDLAFDFEWTNRTLFYGLYKRTNSMFENSALAAKGPPSAAELKLLAPLRGKIPDEVFTTPYESPKSDGTGRNRPNLRKAARLLREAGWRIRDNRLVNARNEPLTIEFLLYESSFQRIINPYIRNLRRIGVEATLRIVDVANFQQRMQTYDFDVVTQRYVQLLTPGVEQKTYYGSASANMPGMRNLGGIQDPAVDYLIEKVTQATSRVALVTAVHALDRVLMWNHYMVPQWYKGVHNLAYWNKFDHPRITPRYDLGVLDTWWYSREKAAMIEAGRAPTRP